MPPTPYADCIVAERLGDSDATVMRTYSHVRPDMQETAAAAIESMLRGLLKRAPWARPRVLASAGCQPAAAA